MTIYAPDKEHAWRLFSPRELKNLPEIMEAPDGSTYVLRNYAGQCWCYEVEKVEAKDGE